MQVSILLKINDTRIKIISQTSTYICMNIPFVLYFSNIISRSDLKTLKLK